MPGKTRVCCKCKQIGLKDDMISTDGKAPWYCKECHEKALETARFEETVCRIFNVKKPGAYVWKQRGKIIEEYGYTDQIITDTLNYIYSVKGYKPLATSICLVKPPMVEEMLQYKKAKDFKENRIVDAIIDGVNNKQELPQIKTRENEKPKRKSSWDEEDYLFME